MKMVIKMKMPLVTISILLTSLYSSTAVSQVSTDTAYLSQMLATMKNQYDKMVEQLDKMKSANDNLIKMRDGIRFIQQEYEFVNSFNLEAQLRGVQSDIAGLTSLSDIHDIKNTMTRINMVLQEIDKHVTKSKNAEITKHMQDVETNNDALNAAVNGYMQESIDSGTTYKTTADQLSGINSATSMIAAQTLNNQKEKQETIIRRTEQAMKHLSNDASIMKYFSRGGE